MNTLVLLFIILMISVKSFGNIASSGNRLQFEKRKKDKLIDQIEKIEIAKDFKNLMNQKQFEIPVVNHELIKLNQSLIHIKKCISEESKGTVDIYIGEFDIEVRIFPSGLVKNIEFINTKEMPIYLKACFLSGISRVVFSQPLDGMETVISRQFNLKLYPEESDKEKRLSLNFQVNTFSPKRKVTEAN